MSSATIWASAPPIAKVVQGARTGHKLLAQSVAGKFAEEFIMAVGGVTGEGDARAGGIPNIGEHHRLHVGSSAIFGRNAVFVAIDDRAVTHP